MDSHGGEADSAEASVRMKYSKASEIDTDVFLAAIHEQTGGKAAYMYAWEIAWALSDHERPESGLSNAPDVELSAVEQKARQLALSGVIEKASQTGRRDYYLIPAKEHPDE